LQRDWLPSDLQPLLAQTRVDGTIAVQARQTLEESNWLLTLADHFPFIKGVVGWVDLRSADVSKHLQELARHRKFVGVRHVVQEEPDDRFIVQPEFVRGISRLAEFNLTYDLLVYPRQLPAAVELVRRFPKQRFVLDHIAKPLVREKKLSPWQEEIRELAKSGNVLCKVSGLITEADHSRWSLKDFVPYLDVVFEAFGVPRLMFGSDWPVCLLAGRYEQVLQLAEEYTRHLEGGARDGFFGGNAARFYLSGRD
jgi:L-fuconolactonase